MKRSIPLFKPLVFSISVALAACSSGGSGSGSTNTTTTVTGTAEAPNGVIAQFEDNKSVLVATIENLIPAAHAAITGLQPVTGATVELIRIDDDGNQVGAVLASTVTSITGDYSLSLPTGVSLAGNLVVRISGNGGASMSAMVVDQAVDINPISQFVLDKFVDEDNLVLADLAVNEVVALSGKVDEFDLSATADLSTMLDQLEAQVGQFVDNQITVITSTPDNGTAAAAIAGKWNSIEMGLGMHDNEQSTSGTFGLNALSEEFTLAAGNPGEVSFSLGANLYLDTFTNFMVDNSGFTSIYHETNIVGEADTFTGMIDNNGTLTLDFPFEEQLETVDTLVDLDGPDFGWRYPPGTEVIEQVANGNVYTTVFTDPGVRYNTVDTNGDGVKDAVDPNSRSGDELEMQLFMLLKEGSGMNTSSIDGAYGTVSLTADVNTAPQGLIGGGVGEINFSSGTVTINANAMEFREITRTPATPPAVTLASTSTLDPADSFPYSVSATGQVTLDVAGPDELAGFANSDGSVLAFVDSESTATGMTVTNVVNEMLVAVKLGSAMQSSLNGASYKLYPMAMNMMASGSSEIFSLNNGLLTFDASSATALLTGKDSGFQRSSDVAQISAITPEVLNETFTIGGVTANGAVSMSITEPAGANTFTTTLKGFVSADSNLLILRLYGENSGGGDYDMGMVIGVKQ